MNAAIVLGIVRHVLTLAAGALASKGVIAHSETETLVGAGLGIIGIIWSALDKKRQAKRLRATPVE